MSKRTTIVGLGLTLALSAGALALLSSVWSGPPDPSSNVVAADPGPSTGRSVDDPEPATPGGTGSRADAPTAEAPSRGQVAGSADPLRRACEPAALLPVSRRILDDPAAKFSVERIEVVACRNGYARVLATPRSVDPPVEGDQLFLRYVDGTWKLVARGASIDCGDAGLKSDTADACRALAR